MADMVCQVTDQVGENDKEVLDAILLRGGLILATLRVNKGKCGNLGCVSCGYGALSETLGS